jgi:hypothetical protein
MSPAALWLINAVAAVAIMICGVRILIERCRTSPRWVRVANGALVIGAACTLALEPALLDWSQVALNVGVAGTLVHRLRRQRAGDGHAD